MLIVGAGPVGQGLAIELGHRGIDCLMIEKNPRIGVAPRAKTTNVRIREHFRRWGLADALRAASPLGVAYPYNVAFATRMSGDLYRVIYVGSFAGAHLTMHFIAHPAATRCMRNTRNGFRNTRRKR